MIGKPVGVPRALSTFPMQNRMVSKNPKAMAPLITIVKIRILGMVIAEFLTSSLMWIAPSNPGEISILERINDGFVPTNETPCDCQETQAPADARVGPTRFVIDQSGKDKLRATFWCQNNQCN